MIRVCVRCGHVDEVVFIRRKVCRACAKQLTKRSNGRPVLYETPQEMDAILDALDA